MTTVVSTKRVRLVQKRRKVRTIKLVSLFALLILAYAGLTYGLTREWATIKTINVTGNSAVPSESLVNSIQREMSGLRAYSLYAGTIFTYDEEAIISTLMYKYPRLKSVGLSSSSIDTLDVEVSERTAVIKWCNESLECYLVDGKGYIFAKVGELTDNLVEYRGAMSGEPLHKTLLPGELAKVREFVSLLGHSGVEVTIVEVLESELRVQSAGHPLLKVKLDEYLERTAGYAGAALKSADYKAYTSSSTSTPEYIDLRFGNRVYYK